MNETTPSYLFYDIETTGLNKSFDQVLQFAAIRTTLDFKELARTEINIKLNPDVIPSPDAILVHRINVNTMLQGMKESEAAYKIHQLFNTPGTISLGYNTLGFDDEFLRFTFYRNLLSPYTHQYQHNCSRMDLYPITILYYLFKRDALIWPTKNDRVSLKLEYLNEANELAKGQAHHAMVDVEATLALTRKLAAHKEMWEYARAYFQKNTDAKRLSELPYSFITADRQHQEGLMISGALGYANNFIAPVVYLGQHLHYKNQTLWLRLDEKNLADTTPSNIAENTFVTKKKNGEAPIILPPKERYLNLLRREKRELAEQNKAWLQQHPEILKLIEAHHRNFVYPNIPEADVYSVLYQTDFTSSYDDGLFRRFHQEKDTAKKAIVALVKDPHYQTLGQRLLGRDHPQLLDADEVNHYTLFLQKIFDQKAPLIDFRNEPHLTPDLAIARCRALLTETTRDEEQRTLLNELINHLQSERQKYVKS